MTDVVVRGAATAEELAAVVAALGLGRGAPQESGHREWRRIRIAALRCFDAPRRGPIPAARRAASMTGGGDRRANG